MARVQGEALRRRHVRCLLLGGIQLGDAPRRLLGRRAAAGGMRIEELEQHDLFASARFAGFAETHSAVIRQLVRQRGDIEVRHGQHRILPRQLRLLLPDKRPDLRRQRWVNVVGGECGQ